MDRKGGPRASPSPFRARAGGERRLNPPHAQVPQDDCERRDTIVDDMSDYLDYGGGRCVFRSKCEKSQSVIYPLFETF